MYSQVLALLGRTTGSGEQLELAEATELRPESDETAKNRKQAISHILTHVVLDVYGTRTRRGKSVFGFILVRVA